jgi:hypothetical protein
MVDLSLITSVYRAVDFLPSFLADVTRVAAQVAAEGVTLELIFVVNDATDAERQQIDAFRPPHLSIQRQYVPRESLYASWNRGVTAANGRMIGFWNVDDVRYADALIEAAGHPADVLYFPLIEDVRNVWYGIPDRRYERRYDPPAFDRDRFRAVPLAGTFFMFTPQIFAQVGPFDSRFRVMGDFDWWIRAVEHTDFVRAEAVAGRWIKHGENLTSGGRGEREREIIYLRSGQYDRLAYDQNPAEMAAIWDEFAGDTPPPPSNVADRLWGETARARWQAGATRRQLRVLLAPFKTALRLFINYTRLRRPLYRLGLVQDKLP